MALLSIATNRRHKNAEGVYVSEPTYHRLVCWGALADVAQRITKGAPLFAEGRIQHSTWKDKDGAEKSASEIVVDQLILLAHDAGKKAAA
jgi:single-strand DNA-binding protein